MDDHYDSMNFGGYELPAWDFQEGNLPDTVDPALLLASPAEGSYDVQEEGEEADPKHSALNGSDLGGTINFLPTISDVPDWYQSNVPLGMSSSSASASTDVDTSTRAPVPNGSGQFSFEHDLSSNVPMRDDIDDKKCSCFKCSLSEADVISVTGFQKYACLFKCGYREYGYHASDTRNFWDHYVDKHFKQDQGYRCPAPKCTRAFKRDADLKRHLQVHCSCPGEYPCDVLGCKYGGKNGFGRSDKLLSHKRNVHEGKATPDQLMRRRTLLPKA